MTEPKKVYPDDLNPFGSDDEDAKPPAQAASTNPFGSEDDDEEESRPAEIKVSVTPTSPSGAVTTFSQLRLEDARSTSGDRRSSDGFALKPPVAPRRVSATDVSESARLSQNSPLTPRSQQSPASARAASSVSGDSQPVSTTPSPVPRVKRRAPGPPVPAKLASPILSTEDVRKSEDVEKKPAVRKSKKPAPPPPAKASLNLVAAKSEEPEESPADAVVPPGVDSGDALRNINGSPSSAKRPSLFKHPGDRDTPPRVPDGPGVIDDVEDQKILEQMRELMAEHRLIEAELRQLLEIPPDRKSESHTAREEQLIKDLVDNVKRREELEYEVEECVEHDADTGAKVVKKMKKKRKFKLKKIPWGFVLKFFMGLRILVLIFYGLKTLMSIDFLPFI